MKKLFGNLVLFSCFTTLVACSTAPLHTAFENLTSEVDVKTGAGLKFSSAITINGLGKQQHGGMYFLYPQKKAPDTYTLGIIPENSMLVETIYKPKPFVNSTSAAIMNRTWTDSRIDAFAMNQVLGIRDTYLQARDETVKMIALEYRSGVANVTYKDPQLCGKTASMLSVEFKEGDCQKEVEEQLRKLKLELRDSQLKVEGLKQQLISMLKTGNIIVTRWSRENSSDVNAAVSEQLAVNRSSTKMVNGIMIMGDLRVVSLLAGEDFLYALLEFESPFSEIIPDVGVVTYSLQVKHLAYVQDMDYSSALAAHLNVSAKQIAGYAGDIQSLYDELELKLSLQLSELASIGNFGIISAPKTTSYDFLFFPLNKYKQFLKEEIDRGRDYTAIHTVRTMPSKIAESINSLSEKEGKLKEKAFRCRNPKSKDK